MNPVAQKGSKNSKLININPGRWRSMATGKVTSGTKKKTSQIPIGRVGLGEVLHNIFYLYECRKQSMCSLIVSRRNSICRCTPETLQLRSGSHNCYRSGELHIITDGTNLSARCDHPWEKIIILHMTE